MYIPEGGQDEGAGSSGSRCAPTTSSPVKWVCTCPSCRLGPCGSMRGDEAGAASPDLFSWLGPGFRSVVGSGRPPLIQSYRLGVSCLPAATGKLRCLQTTRWHFSFSPFPELPRPLAHLCRLQVRKVVGKHRIKLLDALPLPGRLIRYLKHENTQ